jgi:hypothetical protein
MLLLDRIRENKLVELARERFGSEPREAERRVLRDSASSEDVPEPAKDAERPVVQAAFLRWLATDPEAAQQIDPKGLRVYAATLEGDLELQGCRVYPTLNFHCCEFPGRIILFSAETRGIYLFDSSVAGAISVDGAILHGLFFLKNSRFQGEISLIGAKIGGQLNCKGAKLMAAGNALTADGAEIGGGVFLDEGFESAGKIRMVGATIGGDLTFRVAKVAEVSCQNATVKGDLIWQGIEQSERTHVNLAGARVRNLRDDLKSWPTAGCLNLDGLVYEELTLHDSLSEKNIKDGTYPAELPLVAKQRIEWIERQVPKMQLEAQPWMQLRALLERKADRKGANYVLFRYRCRQAREKKFRPLHCLRKVYVLGRRAVRRIYKHPKDTVLRIWPFLRHPNRSWDVAFAWLEENPLRIGWSIALTLLIGTSVFTLGGSKQAMIETVRFQPSAVRDDGAVRPVPALYPQYQPFVYTLENAVPLVKLGMDDKWAPDPSPVWRQAWFPKAGWLYFISTYGVLVFTRWALIVGGWLQATVLAAALAERFKK